MTGSDAQAAPTSEGDASLRMRQRQFTPQYHDRTHFTQVAVAEALEVEAHQLGLQTDHDLRHSPCSCGANDRARKYLFLRIPYRCIFACHDDRTSRRHTLCRCTAHGCAHRCLCRHIPCRRVAGA
eukprot:5171367-Pleurochrysis_carterae.AAC.1